MIWPGQSRAWSWSGQNQPSRTAQSSVMAGAHGASIYGFWSCTQLQIMGVQEVAQGWWPFFQVTIEQQFLHTVWRKWTNWTQRRGTVRRATCSQRTFVVQTGGVPCPGPRRTGRARAKLRRARIGQNRPRTGQKCHRHNQNWTSSAAAVGETLISTP